MGQEGVVINSPSHSDREDLNDTMRAPEALCEEQENPIDSDINEVMQLKRYMMGVVHYSYS